MTPADAAKLLGRQSAKGVPQLIPRAAVKRPAAVRRGGQGRQAFRLHLSVHNSLDQPGVMAVAYSSLIRDMACADGSDLRLQDGRHWRSIDEILIPEPREGALDVINAGLALVRLVLAAAIDRFICTRRPNEETVRPEQQLKLRLDAVGSD